MVRSKTQIARLPLRDMSSTERTPLTTQRPPGPAYVFPGVSPRSRRRQIRQFQCFLCLLFSLIIVLAIVLAVIYTASEQIKPPSDSTESPQQPVFFVFDPMNESEINQVLLSRADPLEDEPFSRWSLPNPLITLRSEAEQYGRKLLGDRELMEENTDTVPVNSPSFRHQRAVGTTAEARKYAKRGFVESEATHYIAKKLNYTKPKMRSDIGQGPSIKLIELRNEVDCEKFLKYRTANGTCNNRKHKLTWGAAMQPFRRILQPDYADGISAPRQSHANGTLPSARQASLEIHRPSYSSDPNFSVMLAVWGQFLDHDITATALSQGPDGSPIDCCSKTANLHPECFSVPLGPGDPYFEKNNITCMNFVRSAPAPIGRYGPRQQLNQASGFIDGSVVYGCTEERQRSLRTGTGGQLRMFVTPDNRTLLPISTDPNDGCNEAEMNAQGKYCFESGDPRANENLLLTSMHLLLARHHNYLASKLQELNPNWSDEKTFQEARKILGAQMQHITYNEFLPVIFGEKFMWSMGLSPKSSGSNDLYQKDVNPSVANGFASSAFRFAHTLLPSLMRATRNDTSEDFMLLHKMLFNPYSLWSHEGVDNALKSAMDTPMARSDQFFTTELTQKLFESSPHRKQSPKCCEPGLDLVSLNIQRGRDHGLPPYYEWRRHCKLPEADTWERMAYAFNNISLESIKKVYKDPKDVDFYCGALSEPPLKDAIVGPVLACILSDQFWRMKYGDSHWYERKDGPQRLTDDQLKEIYKTSLARLMCINSDNIEEVPTFVMKKSDSFTNPIVKCSDLGDFDFSPWDGKRTIVRYTTANISSKVRVVHKNITLFENTTMKALV